MLPLGEDLGSIPDEVRSCLKRLEVPGTKVLRWERRWNEDSSFIPYHEYAPYSLSTVSTHDSEPLRQWWEDFPEDVKRFCEFKGWDYQEKLSKERLAEILRDSHHSHSFFHINLLQEYLNLKDDYQFEELKDERINTPGSVGEHNWSMRFIPNIETMISDFKLKEAIQSVIN